MKSPRELSGTGLALLHLLWLEYSLFIRYCARVWKPTAPEQLSIDFDGFFAACEEQTDRRLQGRPLGVIPFAGAVQSCVIAANTMATRAGVTTGMAIADARRQCPGIALVPQQPDLYTRIHHRIVAAVLDVLPIDAVAPLTNSPPQWSPAMSLRPSRTRSSSTSVTLCEPYRERRRANDVS